MFKYIILLSALLLATCAAWFSVTGIAQLFTGATLEAGIMAASLEIAKIIGVSFLYRYWKNISFLLKSYMWLGVVVLMGITSVGIYGYLTSAYAVSAVDIQGKENQINLYNTQISNINSNITRLNARSEQLQSFRTQQESRLDSLITRGRSIVTQQRIIRDQDTEINQLQKQINDLNVQRDSIQLLTTNTVNSIGTSGKLGTFYYVAQTLEIPLDVVVKWFTLIIVVVFDPMSISLFIAYNFLLKKNDKKELTDNKELKNDISKIIQIPQKEIKDVIIPVNTDVIEEKSVINNDDVPYYRKPGYEWKPGGMWERDPTAIAWRKEVNKTT